MFSSKKCAFATKINTTFPCICWQCVQRVVWPSADRQQHYVIKVILLINLMNTLLWCCWDKKFEPTVAITQCHGKMLCWPVKYRQARIPGGLLCNLKRMKCCIINCCALINLQTHGFITKTGLSGSSFWNNTPPPTQLILNTKLFSVQTCGKQPCSLHSISLLAPCQHSHEFGSLLILGKCWKCWVLHWAVVLACGLAVVKIMN